MLEKILSSPHFHSKLLKLNFKNRVSLSIRMSLSTSNLAAKTNIKPTPNILILSGNQDEFRFVKKFLQSILGHNSYTIYNLSVKDFNESSIWMSNCSLLISFSEIENQPRSPDELVLNEICNSFSKFMQKEGRILTLPSLRENFDVLKTEQHSISIRYTKQKYFFEFLYEQKFKLVQKPFSNVMSESDNLLYSFSSNQCKGVHFVSKILLNSDNQQSSEFISRLYANVLDHNFGIKDQDPESSKFEKKNPEKYVIFSKNELLQSTRIVRNYINEQMNKNAMFIEKHDENHFDQKVYFNHLKASRIGWTILYSELVESTMNSLNYLPNSLSNLVVVSRQQTNGQGKGSMIFQAVKLIEFLKIYCLKSSEKNYFQGNNKNEWLSPIGCCMFTLYLNLNTNDFPMSRLGLLQFAAALSCVQAIIKTTGYENLPLRVKWPNDIYFNGQVKLGGILVKSSILANFVNLKIGIGLNLSNAYPTECLNRICREQNLPEWSSEKLIAKFMNQFEENVQLLSKPIDSSLTKFISEFQNHWLHDNQTVFASIWNEQVKIVGINEFGYLRVKRQDNTEHFLQPDGNRFDMMHNMIVLRN